MQLTPRYDGPPVLDFGEPAGDPSVPLLRQRRRLADVLAGLDHDAWNAPSRCAGWSAQDVTAHLVGTNQFWTASIGAGLAGKPTTILTAFDPVKTPALMVDGLRAKEPSEVLADYVTTVDALTEVVSRIDSAAWSTTVAEAPPGHVALYAVVLHALWDGWIHERDIMLPMGLTPETEADEVGACLRYASAIGPSLAATRGSTKRGTLAVAATDPDTSLVVEAGPTVVVRDGPAPANAPRLEGDAVALVEGLTFRGPLEHGLADTDRWLVSGLDEAFDMAPPASEVVA